MYLSSFVRLWISFLTPCLSCLKFPILASTPICACSVSYKNVIYFTLHRQLMGVRCWVLSVAVAYAHLVSCSFHLNKSLTPYSAGLFVGVLVLVWAFWFLWSGYVPNSTLFSIQCTRKAIGCHLGCSWSGAEIPSCSQLLPQDLHGKDNSVSLLYSSPRISH